MSADVVSRTLYGPDSPHDPGVDRAGFSATVSLGMCGRATLSASPEEIAEAFGVAPVDLGPPRYNIAPGQPLATVRIPKGGGRELALLRWGLVPWWTKPEDAKRMASRCIQARAETLATAPSYRDAFRDRRCLIVVDGFYEWKEKTPHHVTLPDRGLFAIAGVWERWRNERGEIVETAAVVTTPSKGAIERLHDRMPLVLTPSERDAWLTGDVDHARRILSGGGAGGGASQLVAVPVSSWVNDVRHDDPRCIEPAAEEHALGQISLRFD